MPTRPRYLAVALSIPLVGCGSPGPEASFTPSGASTPLVEDAAHLRYTIPVIPPGCFGAVLLPAPPAGPCDTLGDTRFVEGPGFCQRLTPSVGWIANFALGPGSAPPAWDRPVVCEIGGCTLTLVADDTAISPGVAAALVGPEGVACGTPAPTFTPPRVQVLTTRDEPLSIDPAPAPPAGPGLEGLLRPPEAP